MEEPGVGARVRALRCERGLTQAQLAGGTLSESYISLIESGKRQPSRSALEMIAQRLGLSVDGLAQHLVHDDPEISFALAFAELAARNGDTTSAHSAVVAIDEDSRVNGRSAARLRAVKARLAEADGDVETAIGLLEKLLNDAHIEGAAWAEVATSLVRCYRERGDLTKAVDVGERCTALLVAAGLCGTPQHVGVGLTMASAYYERGDVGRAATLVEDLVTDAERVGSREARGSAYWNAALIARGEGRQFDAVKLAEKALALVSEGDDARRLARLTAAHAGILLSLDEPEVCKAIGLLHQSYSQLEECGSSVDLASVATELGRAEILLGKPVEAETWVRRSLELLGDQPRLETARSWLILAQAQALQGLAEAASRTARLSASMLESMGASRQAAQIWRELGDLMRREGESTGACVAYDQALVCMGLPNAAPAHSATPAQSPVKVSAHRAQ